MISTVVILQKTFFYDSHNVEKKEPSQLRNLARVFALKIIGQNKRDFTKISRKEKKLLELVAKKEN